MDLGDLIFGNIGILIFAAVGVMIIRRGFKRHKLRKLIRDTPTSKIRSMPVGPVEVKGKTEPVDNKYVKAPLTGNKCLYFEFCIEKWEKGNDNKKGKWKQVESLQEGNVFYIDDDTGKVKVVPDKKLTCEISEAKTISWTTKYPEKRQELITFIKNSNKIGNHYISGEIKEKDGGIKKFFKKHIKPRKRYRFIQKVIEEGDQLYVYGTSSRLRDATDNELADMKISSGNRDFFFVSDMEEEVLLEKTDFKLAPYLIAGAILIAFCAVWFFQTFEETLN